ncbi:hypothetical protein [Lederbergia citrea]|nr:hypothetical protein [Lederbergia citrea]
MDIEELKKAVQGLQEDEVKSLLFQICFLSVLFGNCTKEKENKRDLNG